MPGRPDEPRGLVAREVALWEVSGKPQSGMRAGAQGSIFTLIDRNEAHRAVNGKAIQLP